MTGWQIDKAWTDQLLPEVKAILGVHLIRAAPIEEDQERNTDLIVLRLDGVRVAVRIRTHNYLAQYGDQFTIREGRPSGVKTELAKIIEGWGDFLFYGFATSDRQQLATWRLIDLTVFRLWFMRRLLDNGYPPGTGGIPNRDGSSTFRAFDVNALPVEAIRAQYIPARPIIAAPTLELGDTLVDTDAPDDDPNNWDSTVDAPDDEPPNLFNSWDWDASPDPWAER